MRPGDGNSSRTCARASGSFPRTTTRTNETSRRKWILFVLRSPSSSPTRVTDVNLPRPTVAFMNELASRRASEVELYQRFGFPDFFTYYGRDWPNHSISIQYLSYAHHDCEVL